ncbi:MAG: undecaprenyl-diphosphate phosphatase [Anaerolineae bacterium]
MSLLQALIIGILQGLTEFLPISSSAHLKLAKIMLGIQEGQDVVLFDLACHLGTLMPLIFFWRQDLSLLCKDARSLRLLFLAILPLIPCYFLFKPLREIVSQKEFLGPALMMTGVILYLGDRFRLKNLSLPSYSSAFWIGTIQSAALIPGISRSASTISCARILGWSMPEAVRFSFLLAIPTIIGGILLELIKRFGSQQTDSSVSFSCCFLGFGAAFLFGTLIMRRAIRVLEKGRLFPFGIYCLVLGAIVLVFFNF